MTSRKFFFAVPILTALALPPATSARQSDGANGSPAQESVSATTAAPIVLTLDEAIQISLARAWAVREARLDLDVANAQVREIFGQLLPEIDLNTTYTRNVRSANPFAGSEAGGLFSTLGFVNWLAYNEQARTDDDGATVPITLADFAERQQAGLDEAGVVLSGSDNLFAIPNQASAVVSVDQKIFDIRALFGAAGARKYLAALNEAALERQEQLIVNDVRLAFYGALLAEESARVVSQSVERTRLTRDETAQRVSTGVLPKYQRLSADVELANLESNLIRARSQSADAVDNLKLLLGVSVDQEVVLRGDLDAEIEASAIAISVSSAVVAALQQRADLEQARIGIKLQEVQAKVARADYFPTLNAFANIGYIGNVPASRQSIVSDPDDPFSFSITNNGFFSDPYWDLTASVGLRLSWNLFNGFQSRNRIQQQKIAIERARVQHERLTQTVKLEVQSAIRELQATQLQIASQRQNVERAELNYDHASARLLEGVASQLEERQASELLDESQLTYLQAVHDFLAARSALETAVGATPGARAELNLTAADRATTTANP